MQERAATSMGSDGVSAMRVAPSACVPTLRTEIIDPAADWTRLEAAWRDLAASSPQPSCFATPVMFKCWQRQLSGDVTSRIIAAYDGTQLVGVMPVMQAVVWRGPSCVPRHDFAPTDRDMLTGGRIRPIRLRQLSPVISIPATYAAPAPLCRPEHETAVTHVIANGMMAMRGWDVIVIPTFGGSNEDNWTRAFASAGQAVRMHRLGRTLQAIDEVRPFADIVAGAPKKFRQNVRRATAAAERAGIAFTCNEGAAAVATALPALRQVAIASWKHAGRAETGIHIPYEGRQQEFFEAVIGEAPTDVRPVLWTAHGGGQPAAALLCAVTGSTLTSLLIFRDQSFPEASLGMLLLAQMIDWAARSGLQRIELNATHEWVRHLVDERRSIDNTVVFAPSWRGRAFDYLHRLAQRRA